MNNKMKSLHNTRHRLRRTRAAPMHPRRSQFHPRGPNYGENRVLSAPYFNFFFNYHLPATPQPPTVNPLPYAPPLSPSPSQQPPPRHLSLSFSRTFPFPLLRLFTRPYFHFPFLAPFTVCLTYTPVPLLRPLPSVHPYQLLHIHSPPHSLLPNFLS